LLADKIAAVVLAALAVALERTVDSAVLAVVGSSKRNFFESSVRLPVVKPVVLPPEPEPPLPSVSVLSGIPSPSVSTTVVGGVVLPVVVQFLSGVVSTPVMGQEFVTPDATPPAPKTELPKPPPAPPPPPQAASAKAEVIRAKTGYKRILTT
jgi:hypothetical protein